jgi:hypothetical protein
MRRKEDFEELSRRYEEMFHEPPPVFLLGLVGLDITERIKQAIEEGKPALVDLPKDAIA